MLGRRLGAESRREADGARREAAARRAAAMTGLVRTGQGADPNVRPAVPETPNPQPHDHSRG